MNTIPACTIPLKVPPQKLIVQLDPLRITKRVDMLTHFLITGTAVDCSPNQSAIRAHSIPLGEKPGMLELPAHVTMLGSSHGLEEKLLGSHLPCAAGGNCAMDHGHTTLLASSIHFEQTLPWRSHAYATNAKGIITFVHHARQCFTMRCGHVWKLHRCISFPFAPCLPCRGIYLTSVF